MNKGSRRNNYKIPEQTRKEIELRLKNLKINDNIEIAAMEVLENVN